MTHRPLDMIKRDIRAAEKAPHLRSRKVHVGLTDTIDTLDDTGIGGRAYHHGGPYDATLAARNTNKLYSPLEAVKDSNLEALKATPREYVQDSLVKHVPLQGTATIPPGETDMAGRQMRYQEGADLMREADAPGGAYKRWDSIPYRPEDLKGKGEAWYVAEEQGTDQLSRSRKHAPRDGATIEMQPGVNGRHINHRGGKPPGTVQVRQRSVSNVAASSSRPAGGLASPTSPGAGDASTTTTDIRRSNTTGKRFSDGLKRRWGSLRRKKAADE